ncbi:UNVERIFIED_CONTAM: hypothetical protein HDU68_003149 [Siphonaria sp. JEL0065]|nr:hypothetical protein HDU68_003149 [Siphonaria sp. JEL0065]
MLSRNDVIFYGDFTSHGVVKNGLNKTLNQQINDLKFYQFKQRLLCKAQCRGKYVLEVPEHYTSRTWSSCGNVVESFSSKKYNCVPCKAVHDRDQNAAKNILMKGIARLLSLQNV